MVLQQLQDALNAATNAPLCDSIDSSDTTVDAGSPITCTATVRSDGASIDCARPLYVSFFYHTNAGGNENPVWLTGNEQTTFGPIDDVRDIVLNIASNDVYVFSQPVEPGIYDFEVPIVEEGPEIESESDEPYFDGTINPRVGENELSFTIPEDYSAPDLWLDLTFECESQEIEAVVRHDNFGIIGTTGIEFVYPDWAPGLPEGICLLNFYVSGSEYLFPDGTYDIVITAATEVEIEWAGTVELEGDVVSLDEGSPEEPYYSGVFDPTTGEDTVTFTFPNNYSASYFILELYAECEDQTVEASILKDGVEVEVLSEMPLYVLNSGLCGVWLIYEELVYGPYGETFEVVIRTETNQRISWSGTVALEGDGVTQDGELIDVNDEQFVWEELFSGEIDAEHVMTFEIPKGGKQIEIRGITTRFENQGVYVDPYLFVLDDTDDVIARNNDGGEDYGFGDYSSRLNVFLEEGTYTLIASTYDIWIGAEAQWPTTYDLELRVGSVPVPADEAVTSGEQPKEQQVLVEVLDAPPSDLDQSSPVFVLPVNEIINRDKSSNELTPFIPAGVTEVVCDGECLSSLREAAGVSEGIVTIQIGGEVIEIQPGVRNAIIPVRPSAKEILVTVTPSDGGEPVVLSTEVLVISPRTFPTKMVTKSASSNGGIPTNLIVVLVVLALGIAIGLIRRQKVRLPE
jgi:hypothetical protein